MTVEDVRKCFFEEVLKKVCEGYGEYPMAEAFFRRQHISISVKSEMLADWEEFGVKVIEYNALCRSNAAKVYRLFKLVESPERCTDEELRRFERFKKRTIPIYERFKDKVSKNVFMKLTQMQELPWENSCRECSWNGEFNYESLMELIQNVLRDYTLVREELSASTLEYMLLRGYGSLDEIMEDWENIRKRLLDRGKEQIVTELDTLIKEREEIWGIMQEDIQED